MIDFTCKIHRVSKLDNLRLLGIQVGFLDLICLLCMKRTHRKTERKNEQKIMNQDPFTVQGVIWSPGIQHQLLYQVLKEWSNYYKRYYLDQWACPWSITSRLEVNDHQVIVGRAWAFFTVVAAMSHRQPTPRKRTFRRWKPETEKNLVAIIVQHFKIFRPCKRKS